MEILIKTVPNREISERAGFTGADWWWEPGHVDFLQIRVAEEVGDWRECMSLAMHEATEALICRHLNITQESVDAFDKEYQRDHEVDLNAGDESDAPYKLPHTFATAVERILTGVFGIDWKKYDDKLSVL